MSERKLVKNQRGCFQVAFIFRKLVISTTISPLRASQISSMSLIIYNIMKIIIGKSEQPLHDFFEVIFRLTSKISAHARTILTHYSALMKSFLR